LAPVVVGRRASRRGRPQLALARRLRVAQQPADVTSGHRADDVVGGGDRAVGVGGGRQLVGGEDGGHLGGVEDGQRADEQAQDAGQKATDARRRAPDRAVVTTTGDDVIQ